MAFWYETFFDERYLDFYPVLRQRPLAREEARKVAELAGLQPGARVLDLGCGTGRHSLALAELGYRVTGLDLSPTMLDRARAAARELNADLPHQPRWLERDMRDLDDLDPFDACLSLFTAWGFFGDQEDQEVLYQVAAALRPGGTLLLDLSNFLGYLTHLPRELWREEPGALMREQNHYEAQTGTLVTRRTSFFKQGGQLELPESRVRAYLPHEVLAMLRRAGFEVQRLYGDLEGAAYDWAESPNQVFVSRRS